MAEQVLRLSAAPGGPQQPGQGPGELTASALARAITELDMPAWAAPERRDVPVGRSAGQASLRDEAQAGDHRGQPAAFLRIEAHQQDLGRVEGDCDPREADTGECRGPRTGPSPATASGLFSRITNMISSTIAAISAGWVTWSVSAAVDGRRHVPPLKVQGGRREVRTV
jgi:hypothetical protein